VSGGVQLPLEPGSIELPLDPVSLAEIPLLERAALYRELGLDFEQSQACEEACRLVIARRYGRSSRDA
jgi:hypothetical protein